MHCIWNTSGGERKITIYFVKKIICYNFGTSYYNCGLGLVYYVLFFFFYRLYSRASVTADFSALVCCFILVH